MNDGLFDDVRLVAGGWRWTRRRITPALPRPASESGQGDVVFQTAWARSAIVRALREAGQAAALPLLLHSALDVSVAGTDQLQRLARPAVFVANHASHLDALLVLYALPSVWRQRTVIAAAADYFFSDWGRSALAALTINAVPVERSATDTGHRDLSGLLAQGWSVLTFPEGTRSRDGSLRRFHHGAARIAQNVQVPLVPVGVRGTFRAMPVGARWPGRGRPAASVRFGDPVVPVAGERMRDLTARVRLGVETVLEEDATTWWHALRRPSSRPASPVARWRSEWDALRPIDPARPPIWRR